MIAVNVFASFALTTGGQTSDITQTVRIATGYTPGDWWHVQVEASGTNPTHLQSRAWKDGTIAPTAWTLDVTDESAALQTYANAVQIGIWVSADQTVLPLGARFDDITMESRS